MPSQLFLFITQSSVKATGVSLYLLSSYKLINWEVTEKLSFNIYKTKQIAAIKFTLCITALH